MKVDTFIKSLVQGEVALTGFVDPQTREVLPGRYVTIVNALNESLAQLYTLFKIRTIKTPIKLRHRTYEKISLAEYPDLIKVLEIRDSSGRELHIGSTLDKGYQIHLSQFNELEIYTSRKFDFITVVYQANHPLITENFKENEEDLNIPPPLLSILKNSVSSKLLRISLNPTNLQLAQMYEQTIEKDIQLMVAVDALNTTAEMPRGVSYKEWL